MLNNLKFENQRGKKKRNDNYADKHSRSKPNSLLWLLISLGSHGAETGHGFLPRLRLAGHPVTAWTHPVYGQCRPALCKRQEIWNTVWHSSSGGSLCGRKILWGWKHTILKLKSSQESGNSKVKVPFAMIAHAVSLTWVHTALLSIVFRAYHEVHRMWDSL